jgi:ribosomal protein S12 methylthiotransferase
MAHESARVGFVNLGCAKALVDSERILTRLAAEGYAFSDTFAGADVVVVNTCGFLETTREESLQTIGEAMAHNGRVIVTGCLGAEPDVIRRAHPKVFAVTGPHQYEAVVTAVREAAPITWQPFTSLVPEAGVRLTPRHYAYLKISEGCNNTCTFCIIPHLRGRLVSRPIDDVLREAEQLVAAGVRELLVVSQDTSAYGVDLRYAERPWRGRTRRSDIRNLCEGLSELGVWVRLHYVYPYPHVDDLLPLMAEGRILPYLDVPFQHASPSVLKAMRRPANQEKVLERLRAWRDVCPDIAIRSTFIVGFPGETDADFDALLNWLAEARLDRVGCFAYEPVTGAEANGLDDAVPEAVKQERYHALLTAQQAISRDALAGRVGRETECIIDEVDDEGAIGRTRWDAPSVDGIAFLQGATEVSVGDIVRVRVDHADDYDVWASRIER